MKKEALGNSFDKGVAYIEVGVRVMGESVRWVAGEVVQTVVANLNFGSVGER